ncbi:MAG TPA: GNAT family N-acetyltransferase [Anaerolineae bacterium]|nr:GNAT family N-acetyltransferase [Anaerolineae bacterium]
MSRLFELLPWDSEFFGLPIGRVIPTRLDESSAATLQAEVQAEGVCCLYFEAEANDPTTVAVAERHGFHLVDVRVVLEHPFDHRPAPVPRYPVPAELIIGPPRDDELDRLQDISAQIGLTSRFNFDKNIGVERSERLYRLWIEKACQGMADVVLVARWLPAGDAVGLITCTLRHGMADIQLAGVHLDHRQRNVGTGLVQAALDWAKAQGVPKMQVVTQARNVPAQRLYQQMGFFTRSVTLYYHKWL